MSHKPNKKKKNNKYKKYLEDDHNIDWHKRNKNYKMKKRFLLENDFDFETYNDEDNENNNEIS